jgi:hypothetical protein
MGGDYVYPSIYFAYFFFAIMVGVALYFLARSWRDGYFGAQGEEIKYRMMDDEELRAGESACPTKSR